MYSLFNLAAKKWLKLRRLVLNDVTLKPQNYSLLKWEDVLLLPGCSKGGRVLVFLVKLNHSRDGTKINSVSVSPEEGINLESEAKPQPPTSFGTNRTSTMDWYLKTVRRLRIYEPTLKG